MGLQHLQHGLRRLSLSGNIVTVPGNRLNVCDAPNLAFQYRGDGFLIYISLGLSVCIYAYQYQLPMAAPVSHGCVRLTESDAHWNFNWADLPGKGKAGNPVIIINYNPVGLAAHWQESYNGSAQSLVNLPADPMAEPKRNYATK